MGPDNPFFIVWHGGILIAFALVFGYAWKAVSKLRYASAAFNSWLLPFAYFSLSSWILWALQYSISLINSFNHFQLDLLQKTGLCLGSMQLVLWASSVLPLHFKQFPRTSLIVSLWIMSSIVIVLVTYLPEVVNPESLVPIQIVTSTAVFLIFAYEIVQLRHSLLIAFLFFAHGSTQWIWITLWIKPLEQTRLHLVLFPVWYIALLIVWITLIKEMLVTFRVMISSTVHDLKPERIAAANAVRSLQLDSIRAETFGSLRGTPQRICASWAEKCEIFILIIGQRYGHVLEPRGISVVQFEYETAHAQDPEKILVYVKVGVERDEQLEKFLEQLQDFEHGHFRAEFTTPEDLYKRVQYDVKRWLKEKPKKD